MRGSRAGGGPVCVFLNEPLKAETVERTTWLHSTQGGCTVAATAAVVMKTVRVSATTRKYLNGLCTIYVEAYNFCFCTGE